MALRDWGDRYMAPDGPPVHFGHSDCGGEAHVTLACDTCGTAVTAREIVPVPVRGCLARNLEISWCARTKSPPSVIGDVGASQRWKDSHAPRSRHRRRQLRMLKAGRWRDRRSTAARSGTGTRGSALAPWVTGGQLPNFAAAAGPERLACYDEDTLYWLAGLTERYDPAGDLPVGRWRATPCRPFPRERAPTCIFIPLKRTWLPAHAGQKVA
jgi:hypothetical protein